MKILIGMLTIVLLASCGWNKRPVKPYPSCIAHYIDSLSKINEQPISVTQYDFRNQKVYYIKSACCDRYNIVFDNDCNLLGYPDGGFTGKADGSLKGFYDSAQNPVTVWKINN